MRALVTGGAGLIGSHLTDLLLENGFAVRILDSLEKPTHLQGKPPWVPPQAEFIEGSVLDRKRLSKALAGVDLVFHQAAFGGFTPESKKYFDVNAGAVQLLFDVLAREKHAVKKVVVASSQAVYGEGAYACPSHGPLFPGLRMEAQLRQGQWEHRCPDCQSALKPLPTAEDAPLGCATPYALSKLQAERLALAKGRQAGIPVTALRYSLTYGPRQSLTNPYTGICSIFSTRLLNGLPPVVFEDGLQSRDFVFVGDVARANLLTAESSKADFGAFNVGTGQPTTVRGFIDALNDCYGTDLEPAVEGRYRSGEVRHLYADTARLASLGFAAKTSLRQGLQAYADWIRSLTVPKEYFSEAQSLLLSQGVIREVKK